ncbi:MAG: class I SAM-dependent methyltransferase [Bacteroidales bacterium]|jgi:2-polyprenyl-3-methyl-5-hydroxy-6-metoxy-1,4-benzoquinol methylase|nr:class I SAM-dependent methyltransferase [Bacteroidales bacterium]
MHNINTKDYWDSRFKIDNLKSWKSIGGESQTKKYARRIVQSLKMTDNFSGTILDFGCAMGDAIPVYKEKYPLAKYIGMDFSDEAIKQCKAKFQADDNIKFIVGSVNNIPKVDVIIISHVLEHLSNDKDIVSKLLEECNDLYIAVPFEEKIEKGREHINSYNSKSFDYLTDTMNVSVTFEIHKFKKSLKAKLLSFFHIELKNLIRPFFKKPGVRYMKCIFIH